MTRFTKDEHANRLNLIRPIVQAAFSIRGRVLAGKELEQHAQHWAAALGRVATPQLRELYHAGLEQQCETAEGFLAAWEGKVEAEFRAAQHRQTLNRRGQKDDVLAGPPKDILKSWTGKKC